MLDDIARRICDFLKAAIEQRRPERDVPMAEQIMADFLAALPVEEPGWSQGIEHVARIVAAELQENTEAWLQAIRLVAIYFDSIDVGEDSPHPRVTKRSAPELTRWSDRIPGRIAVDLVEPLVRRLLEQATPAARAMLFERSTEWEILSVLLSPLLLLDLSAEEVSMLLGPADRLTQAAINRAQYLDPFRDWAGRNIGTAKNVVERWLRREPGFVELGHSAIDVLVEGVVAHDADELRWRDEVVERLSRSRDAASWQLAAYLACFAWPEDSRPPVAQRHAALRKHVERSPERMLATALQAMARDASQHPAEAVNTSLALHALWPREEIDPEHRASIAIAMARVANAAAWAITHRQIESPQPIPWSSVLEQVIDVPPHLANEFDYLVSELVEIERDVVEAFLPLWLHAHAGALHAEYRDLESLLPTAYLSLGDEGMSRILVRCAVQPDGRLRHVAIVLMNRGRSVPVDDAFSEFSDTHVRAFVHETVGTGATGDFWIPLVFRLGRMRPETLPEFVDILLEDAVPNYPGLCRKYLPAWSSAGEHGPERGPPPQAAAALDEASRMLLERLEQLENAHEHKRTTVEIRTTLPAAAYWAEIMNRMMQQSFERQRRFASPFLARIPTQPIARGEATMASTAGFRVPFAQISAGSFHMPIRDSVDPVAAVLARHAHRQRAAELLGGGPGELSP